MKLRCKAKKNDGSSCNNYPIKGEDYCNAHKEQNRSANEEPPTTQLPRISRNHIYALACILLAVIVLAYFALLHFNDYFLSEKDRGRKAIAKVCTKMIPQEFRAAVESIILENQDNRFLDAEIRKKVGTENEKIIDNVRRCILNSHSEISTVSEVGDFYNTTKPLPLGLVAQQWQGSSLNLYLERASSDQLDRVLNNLRFGPSSGDRRDTLSQWCQYAEYCATCSPAPDDKDQFSTAHTVSITLIEKPRVEKQKMGGTWSKPVELWELVDDTGTRYFYHCLGG